MILKQRQGWTTEQKGNIRKVLEDKLGPGRRGSPLLLSGEDASIEIPNPLADLDWPGLTSLSETRICAAFGVPPIIIHLRSGLERSTYANYAVALKAFYETTMVPIWIMLQESFTKGLLRDEGDEVSSFWYDTSKVKALQVDEAMLADRAVKLFQGGLITRNKAREMIGEDTLPPEIGDVFVLPAGLIETPVTLPSIGEGEHLVEWEAGA